MRRTPCTAIALPFDDDLRDDPRLVAGLERVAAQVAERLAKQDLVAFDPAELAAHDDVTAPRAHVGADLLGRALDEAGHLDRRQRQLGRTGEVQEVGDDLSERLGLVADALHVGAKVSRQAFEIEQPAVAVDRREPVAELVGDAGGHLAEPSEAVLQPELFFELHHFGQIAEEADDAVRGAAGLFANRRNRQAQMRRDAARQRHRPAHDRPRRRQAFLEDVGERPGVLQHLAIGAFPAVPRQTQHRLAGGIQRADDAVAIDDEEAGGQAGDDLAAQTLRRFGARLHRAFAVAELADRVFHGRRHEGRLAPVFRSSRVAARAAAKMRSTA